MFSRVTLTNLSLALIRQQFQGRLPNKLFGPPLIDHLFSQLQMTSSAGNTHCTMHIAHCAWFESNNNKDSCNWQTCVGLFLRRNRTDFETHAHTLQSSQYIKTPTIHQSKTHQTATDKFSCKTIHYSRFFFNIQRTCMTSLHYLLGNII